jgi:toxin-antitoxin system PIN domain toxin
LILPDVNVLIYAFRKDSVRHADYRKWLDSVVNGNSIFGLSPQVLCSLIRICTNPRVYVNPSDIKETTHFCNVLLETNSRLIEPGPRHWEIFTGLCIDEAITGNLVQDAWFAALAIESGCEWITTDGDYARFQSLNWRRPF